MSSQNLSWGILSFGIGLVASIIGIILLAVFNPDPVSISALTTVGSTCAVGISAAMNPNKKFSEVSKELDTTVQELKDTLK